MQLLGVVGGGQGVAIELLDLNVTVQLLGFCRLFLSCCIVAY